MDVREVPTGSGKEHDQGELLVNDPARGTRHSGYAYRASLVEVRLMGPPDEVAEVARRLRTVAPVVDERGDYPRRNGAGVRRYLKVVLGSAAGRLGTIR